MFLNNSKIERALKIINTIEDGKFSLLLSRIAQSLTTGSVNKPFTPVEEAKLENSLEITKEEVETLVDGIIEIFLESAYCVLKPSLLGEKLEKSLLLSAKKAETFVQVWAGSAKGIVDSLRQKSFFPQVNHISYSVSVETASESTSKEKCPKAQLQLSLSEGQDLKELSLEFSNEELYELYKKLEQIQGQLDALSKNAEKFLQEVDVRTGKSIIMKQLLQPVSQCTIIMKKRVTDATSTKRLIARQFQ